MASESVGADYILMSDKEFDVYKGQLNRGIGIVLRHVGTPDSYPCIVKTFADIQVDADTKNVYDEFSNFIHLFVYPDEAEKLVIADEVRLNKESDDLVEEFQNRLFLSAEEKEEHCDVDHCEECGENL